MISLNTKLQNIGVLFGDVLGRTYHYRKSDRVKPPYAVWMEDGEDDSLYTDGDKGEQAIAGTLDFSPRPNSIRALMASKTSLMQICRGGRSIPYSTRMRPD